MCGEENGAVRKVGRLGAHAMHLSLHGSPQCWAGQAPGWAGCRQQGGPHQPYWVANVRLLECGEVMNIQRGEGGCVKE